MLGEATERQHVDTGRVKLYKISTVKTGEKSFSPGCLSSDRSSKVKGCEAGKLW